MLCSLWICLSCVLGVIQGESCDGNHTILNQMDHRTSNFSGNALGWYISDYYVSGWYDVGRNNMPTDSSDLRVGGDSCGTYYPVWMNGTIPGASDGKVNRTACVMTRDSACGYQFGIEVINCGTHMLYNLSPIYYLYKYYLYWYWYGNGYDYYYSAYCFNPSDLAVSLRVQPWLYFANENDTSGGLFKKPKMMFRCQMNEETTDDFYYSTTWYVNDVFLVSKGPVLGSAINETNLHESELITAGYKLDINIYCVINTSNSTEGDPFNVTTSQLYYLGIRVRNPNLNVIQGSSTTIKLQPTFPFGCSSRVNSIHHQAKCLLSVHMFDPKDSNDCKGSSISVIGSQRCGVEIPGFYYDEWRDGGIYDNVTEMTIATRDPNDYQEGPNRFELKLMLEGTGLNDIIRGSYISDIVVTTSSVTSWQEKTCYSYVDPHMRSFDGRYYENQNTGVFVLYRHTYSKQEVQMKTKKCNSVATCACAVAVRAGGDIFLIDLCGTPGLVVHVSCKDNILDVIQITPYSYKIYMPLRTMVYVTINNWWGYESTLNLNIYPSVRDVQKTEGLCGLLNNNQGDDFTTPSGTLVDDNNEFSLSWSLQESKSLFHTSNHNPGLWDENTLFCVCPAALNTTSIPSTSSGSKFDPICSASLSLSCSKKDNVKGTKYDTCNIRTKRSKQSFYKEIERILRRENDKDVQNHNLVKRSISNITFEEALDECSRFFSNNCTTAMFAEQLPNNTQNSLNSSITNCALDYTYTGNMSLASLHCETYRSEVDEEIERNSTFREANPQVVNSFRAMACINDCSNHGDCVNGSCICQDNYIDVDCSLSLSNPPVVEDTYSRGLCQSDKDACCGEVPIYGNRFVKGITRQRLENFNIHLNGSKHFEEPVMDEVQITNPYLGIINIPCHRSQRSTDSDNSSIPFVLGSRISLTNNGLNYGSAQFYYIFDSKCQGVSNGSDGYSFYLLDGTCFISGSCYSGNEQNVVNTSLLCQPNIDRFSWTYNYISPNDPPLTKDMTAIIAAVCTGIVVIILVITTVNIIRCYLKKKQRIAEQYVMDPQVPTVASQSTDQDLFVVGKA